MNDTELLDALEELVSRDFYTPIEGNKSNGFNLSSGGYTVAWSGRETPTLRAAIQNWVKRGKPYAMKYGV